MTFENLCCTVKQAQALVKLGVDQNSSLFLFFTHPKHYAKFAIRTVEQGSEFIIAAYNMGELGAMLLGHIKGCNWHHQSGMWTHDRAKWDPAGSDNLFLTQAECYADRLICLMTIEPVKYSAAFVNARLKKFYELKREA